MSYAVLAPLALVVVLLTSAVAKWSEADSTLNAIRLLRLPAWLQHRTMASALPKGELGLAGLLLLTPAGWPAQAAAVLVWALMATYLLIIGRALTFDPRPNCGCFGRIGNHKVSERTALRNALLFGLASVWVWATFRGFSVPGLLGGLGVSGWAWIVLTGAVVATGVLIVGAEPTPTPAREPITRIDVGADEVHVTSPEVDDELDYIRKEIPLALLQRPDRSLVTLHELAATRPQLLVFVNCYCGSTYSSWDLVKAWRERLSALDIHMVFSAANVPEPTEEYPATDAFYDHMGLAWRALEMPGTSSAVLLGADGQLAGGPVTTEEMEDFFADIFEVLASVPAPLPMAEPSVVSGEVVLDPPQS